jgi:hypothetical protein
MPFPVTCSTPSSKALAEYLPTVYDIGNGKGQLGCFFAHQGWCDVYLVQAPRTREPAR